MPAERFVLDASVAVEWFLPGGGPGGRYAEGILERIGGEELVPAVPDLWHYELGSVLIAARRDKRISAAKLRASQLAIRGLKPETLISRSSRIAPSPRHGEPEGPPQLRPRRCDRPRSRTRER